MSVKYDIIRDKLITIHHKIEDMKQLRTETWFKVKNLNEKEPLSRDESKELSNCSNLISQLNYDIMGRTKDFKTVQEELISVIIAENK